MAEIILRFHKYKLISSLQQPLPPNLTSLSLGDTPKATIVQMSQNGRYRTKEVDNGLYHFQREMLSLSSTATISPWGQVEKMLLLTQWRSNIQG